MGEPEGVAAVDSVDDEPTADDAVESEVRSVVAPGEALELSVLGVVVTGVLEMAGVTSSDADELKE